MSELFSRRQFVVAVPGLGLASTIWSGLSTRAAETETKNTNEGFELWAGFPRQDSKLVREVVTVAHFNEARVRELVELKPALVNAWWDWGFGDWESPLGAASHVGNRGIAEFLIERGARIDIFATAMLGMTETVKAFVLASPGVQRTHGPHGIPLLAHAQAGKEKAKETLAYLESLGDAGNPLPSTPLSDEQKQVYLGRYRFGSGPTEELQVKLNERTQLQIVTGDDSRRPLNFVGNDEFFPAGVPSVRIRFDVKEGTATSLTIVERGPILTANRVST